MVMQMAIRLIAAWVISLATCIPYCLGQAEIAVSLRSSHAGEPPSTWGWNVEAGYATPHRPFWCAARFAGMSGQAHYREAGFRVHDSMRRYGVVVGGYGRIKEKWMLRGGVQVELVRVDRTIAGEPSSWLVAYDARGIYCGFSGRVLRSLSNGFSLWAGVEPGYFFVIEHSAPLSTFESKSIRNDPYVGLLLGVTYTLK